jgi:small subunit ribosomal protein S27e
MDLPRSKFLKVKCNDCGSEQMVFGNSASEVKCLVCGKALVRPAGGKAVVLAKVTKVLD